MIVRLPALLSLALLCCLALPCAAPAAGNATGLPRDYQEFKQRYASRGKNLEGAVKLYFDAVFCYITRPEAQRGEALKMLRYAQHRNRDWERTQPASTFMERLNNPQYHHIFRSFAAGTSPENNYRMTPENYQLMFAGSRKQGGLTLVYLRSSGADNVRMVTMRRYDDGLWYMTENAGTYAQVREPVGARNQHSHDADYDR